MSGATGWLDYHMHTRFSVDSKAEPAAMCERALALGLREIAFTDHVDFEADDPGCGYFREDEYRAALKRCRERFGDRLAIRVGVEVGYSTPTRDAVLRFLDGKTFDFVIGSVHCLDRKLIYPESFAGKTTHAMYTAYFGEIRALIETGYPSVIGHLDLPQQYAPPTHRDYDPRDYWDQLGEIFELAIAHGIGFEVNTSGLRQPGGVTMPSLALIAEYVRRGGRVVTVGSDAHRPEQIAAGFEPVYAGLRALAPLGLGGVSRFTGRAGIVVAWDELATAAVGMA